MLRDSLLLAVALLLPGAGLADEPRTFRLDYYHTGNTTQELFSLDRLVLEPLPWPGNPHRPIDDLDLGHYAFEVKDAETGKVLYSRGYSTIYGEWVTTAEARTATRTFHESLRFPAPEKPFQIIVRKRDARNVWQPAWTLKLDPKDQYLDRSVPDRPGALIEIEKNGPPAKCVDLLILGDGYTEAERGKFEADARRLAGTLLATSPFKERRKDFNVWGLCPPSRETGITRPSLGLYRNSPLASAYDIFGSERYLLTFDNRALRRAASFAPYDFVTLIANERTYGGGALYGQFAATAASSTWAPYVFVHEFGHHFAALADEYYTSPVAYLPPKERVEPWGLNVTALLDPKQLKWKDLVRPDTPLPTPWRKEEYDNRSRAYQKQRAGLRKDRRPEEEIDALFREEKRVSDSLLGSEKYAGTVGAFEGAMYEAKGLYRAETNCIMFTRSDAFCIVCRRAVERVIDQYTRE